MMIRSISNEVNEATTLIPGATLLWTARAADATRTIVDEHMHRATSVERAGDHRTFSMINNDSTVLVDAKPQARVAEYAQVIMAAPNHRQSTKNEKNRDWRG